MRKQVVKRQADPVRSRDAPRQARVVQLVTRGGVSAIHARGHHEAPGVGSSRPNFTPAVLTIR